MNKKNNKHIRTKEQFIQRASIKHNNFFNYSKVRFADRGLGLTFQGKPTRKLAEYSGESYINIICPQHGVFSQMARKHIEGSGCKYCALEQRSLCRVDKHRTHNFIETNKFEITDKDFITIYCTPSDGIEREVLISYEDKIILEYSKWFINIRPAKNGKKKNRTEYCQSILTTRLKQENFSWLRTHPKLHRLILSRILGRELKVSEHVDHINHNGLDNRRENLRIATVSQNHANEGKRRGNYSSKYKGVYLRSDRLHLGYHARISSKSEGTIWLGRFGDDEVAAARAYDRKALELFGEFAYLNFPREDYE